MSRCRLWGISLMVVSAFKLAMAPIFGVPPDPVNLTITLLALALGGLLIFWSLATRNQRLQAGDRKRHVGRDPLCRCASETRT